MKKEIRLKPLISCHQDFLWEMLYLAVYLPPGHPPYPRSILEEPGIAAYAKEWGRENDLGLVACNETDRLNVGAAWLRLFPLDAPGYGFVNEETPELSMAVVTEYRGRGIGRRLLTELMTAAKERFPAVSLSVAEQNPARRLYESFGFKAVCREGDSITMLTRSGPDLAINNPWHAKK